jgi:hypothetical protein
LTPATGAISANECISPDVNFALGFLTTTLCIAIAIAYIIRGRFLRLSFYRFHDYLSKKIEELPPINERLVKAVLMQELDRKNKPSSKDWRWNYFRFFVCSFVAVFVLTSFTFALSLIHIGFGALILWRDYKFHINMAYAEIVKRQLETAFGFIGVLCTPFLQFFALLSSIDINLDAVGVTCDGSKAPLLLTLDFIVLGFIVVVIVGDYNVVLNCVYSVLHRTSYRWINSKVRHYILHELGLKRLGFFYYMPWYTIASVIGIVLGSYPIIALSQILMGYVTIYPLLAYDPSINSPACNRVAGVPDIDAFLGWSIKILIILMAPPVAYCIADILVPRYYKDESFNVFNNDTTGASTKNVGRVSTGVSATIFASDLLDEVKVIGSVNAISITKNMFKDPINVTDLKKNNSKVYDNFKTLFDFYLWAAPYLQVDVWLFDVLHAWFVAKGTLSDCEEIRKDADNYDKEMQNKSIEEKLVFPDLKVAQKLDLQEKWIYFMRKKLPMYFKFAKFQAKTMDTNPMFDKFIDNHNEQRDAFLEQLPYVKQFDLELAYACAQKICFDSYYALYYFALVVSKYLVRFLVLIACYSGYGFLVTDDGRTLWYLVMCKYLLFLQVSLFGMWDNAAYKAYGILNQEYSINMNMNLHAAIRHAAAGGNVAPLSFDPSVLVHSMISIRAVLFLLIPKLSFICVFCKNTAAFPLLASEVESREMKDLPVYKSIMGADPDLITNKFLDRKISIDFLPLHPVNIESDIDPTKNATSYVLYWMNYINEYVQKSRRIQWLYGAYLTAVSMGILFYPDSSGWGYSLLCIALPMAFINSIKVIVFFSHYFKIFENDPHGADVQMTPYNIYNETINPVPSEAKATDPSVA